MDVLNIDDIEFKWVCKCGCKNRGYSKNSTGTVSCHDCAKEYFITAEIKEKRY